MVKRPTLKDVAREAGLSITQVSRALNDHADVAARTKRRVRDVADELGYVVNLEAQRLKAPHLRAGSIGLVLSDETLRFSDPFFGELMSAMVVAAGRNGTELHLSAVPSAVNPIAPYETAIRRNRVDGFVLLRTEVDDARVAFLQAAGANFVSFVRPEGTSGFASVELADGFVEPALQHLVSLGHRRITCLAEPARYAMAGARLTSLVTAGERIGLGSDDIEVVEAGFHEFAGHEAARTVLARPDRPTAILAVNDLLAIGALTAAAELGLTVPDQLSVVGIDDIPAAAHTNPPLTTIRLSAAAVGEALIDELIASIESESVEHRSITLEPNLVVRRSTAAPHLAH